MGTGWIADRQECYFLSLQPDEHAGVFESFQVPFCRYGYRFCQGAVRGFIKVVLRRYYGIDNLLAGSQVNPAAHKELYPTCVFDLSKQSERLTEGVVDLTVKMEFSENIPADTQAYTSMINLKAMDQR